MPQGSIHVSRPLTNLSVDYKNMEYIADAILPQVPVQNESDVYYVYGADFRLPETLRANKAYANMSTWEASTGSYSLEEHSQKDVISDRDYNNADSELQIERYTMERLIDKILLRKEYETQKLLFTTTTFSNNTTLTTATSWKYNTTTSAPIQNMLSATSYIVQNSGKKANKAIMSIAVRDALKENPNVYGRIQYTQRAILTEELLASIFDLEQVLVGSAVYDTAKEGDTSSNSGIWGDDCLVGYFKAVSLKDATAAVNLFQRSFGSPYRVKKWRDEAIEGNYIEVQSMYKPKAIATTCGYLFKSVKLV